MVKKVFYVLIIAFFFFNSCKRQKVLPSIYLTFNVNPSYTGSHPTAGLVSSIYVQDKGDYMQFLTDLTAADHTKEYKLHIHRADSTEPFGYTGNPVIDLGTLKQNGPVATEVTYLSFSEFFHGSFKGYYAVHDPDNVNNDTTTLLIFGKIGNW